MSWHCRLSPSLKTHGLTAPSPTANRTTTATAAAPIRPQHPSRRPPLRVSALLAPSTTNPAFTGFGGHLDDAIVESRYGDSAPMTVNGTVNKTACLLVLTAASAAVTWGQLLAGGPAAFPAVMGATKIAGVVALAAAVASMFKPLWSNVTVRALSAGRGAVRAAAGCRVGDGWGG